MAETSPIQGALAPLFAAAGKHLEQGDYGAAIQIFQRAHRLDPRNNKNTLDLGSAHALGYDFAAAEAWFERAVESAPDKVNVLLAIAERWSDVRQFDASGKAFERVCDQTVVPLGAFYGLVRIYLRQRRLDEALKVAERAVQLHPGHEAALLARAQVYREMDQPEEAEKLLRSVLSRAECDPQARVAAFYELGGVLDRQQRFDEAMTALLEAKALLRASARQATRVLRVKQATMKQIQEGISPATIERWRKAGESDLQPRRNLALLCGHARSGTTLLEYVLDAHPQIICADESSVFQSKAYPLLNRSRSANDSFFSGLDWISARNLRQVRSEYFRGTESFLGQVVGERLLIDKNPALTADIAAICRILPETRFLFTVRDPRDVCLSCFMQAAPILPDSVPWLSLEETIKHYRLVGEMWRALKPCLGGAALEGGDEGLVH